MPRRILIVRLSALGDTALTLPLLWALRARLPDAFLGWAAAEPAAALLRNVPGLDRLHVWPARRRVRGLRRLVREVREERYDLSLDVQSLTKSALVPFLARVPERVGWARQALDGRELAPLLNNRLLRPPQGARHIVGRNLHMGTALGIEMPAAGDVPAALPVDEGAAGRMRAWLDGQNLSGRLLVLGAGALWPTKVWPIERVVGLARAAREQGLASVFLWGPAEREELPRWREALGKDGHLGPPTDVAEMVALLSLAERYAGPDSAPLHIAALLNRPTFSWFGASDPARCAPVGAQHRHVAKDLACRFCWKRRCRSSACVRELAVEEVMPSFLEWLKS